MDNNGVLIPMEGIKFNGEEETSRGYDWLALRHNEASENQTKKKHGGDN